MVVPRVLDFGPTFIVSLAVGSCGSHKYMYFEAMGFAVVTG